MTPDQAATLARIEERTSNTNKALDIHIEDDHQRFERTFAFVKSSFDKIDERFDKVDARFDTTDEKLSTLWDGNNRREGAFGFGKWVAGAVGGLIVAIVDFLINQHGGSKP